MQRQTPAPTGQRRVVPATILATVAALAMALAVGCSSAPEVSDVTLMYCKKAEKFSPAEQNKLFNESHAAFAKWRGTSGDATIPVPGADDHAVNLAALPEGLTIPVEYETLLNFDADNKTLTWQGVMRTDQRDDLRQLSDSPQWRGAIESLYDGARAVEVQDMGRGFDLNRLPPATYPYDDEMMRKVPASFEQMEFFKNCINSPSEARALAEFNGSAKVRECIILGVDGKYFFLPQPNLEDFFPGRNLDHNPPSDAEAAPFIKQRENFKRYVTVFLEFINDARPPGVNVNEDGSRFTAEQRRLHERANHERDTARDIEERNTRDAANPGSGTLDGFGN